MVKRKKLVKKRARKSNNQKIKIYWKTLIFILIIVYAVAGIGSLAIGKETSGSWYESVKPALTPPNFVFPIVWSVLFLLIGFSLYYSWIVGNKKQRIKIAWVFAINFVLNIAWSYLYFKMHNPLIAFVDLILLFLSIVSMIYVTWRVDKKAAWFLLPYALWIIFAGLLNYLSIH